MTFSIVAFDSELNEWGVAVQSKFVAVGSIVPFAKAKVGAIATQAYANTSFGPKGLALLEKGQKAEKVLEKLLQNDSKKESRQVGIVDSFGNAASFTGKDCFDWAGNIVGENFTCQGNILASKKVISNMAKAFENSSGDLVERFFIALEAAQKAGGDKRGKESAAILIVREKGAYDGGTDRYIDIRVDEHPHPIKELKKVFEIYNLCILNRDDPKDILEIKDSILDNIVKILFRDGFLENKTHVKYTESIKKAFSKWMHTNNFEVKERNDNFVFGSVYNYIETKLKEK